MFLQFLRFFVISGSLIGTQSNQMDFFLESSFDTMSSSSSLDQCTIIERKEEELTFSFDEDNTATVPKQIYDVGYKDIVQVHPLSVEVNDSSSSYMNAFNCSNQPEVENLDNFINPFGNMHFIPSMPGTIYDSIPEMYLTNTNCTTNSEPPIQSCANHQIHYDTDEQSVSSSTSKSILETMSDNEILNLIATIPALTKKIGHLQTEHAELESRFSNLESKCIDLESENTALKAETANFRSECNVRFNKGEQYGRRNCLLGHKFRNVPTNVHGTAFSKYVTEELNRIC